MNVTSYEVSWNEPCDQIRGQSAHMCEEYDEARLLLMNIRETPGLEPTEENRHVYEWLERHGLISDEYTNGYVCYGKGPELADRLIAKETAYERHQRRRRIPLDPRARP